MSKTSFFALALALVALGTVLWQFDWSKEITPQINEALTVKHDKSPVGELAPSGLFLKSDHVKITKTGSFTDDTAYGHVRCSYEIIDLKTGRRYIGVSGIGIVDTNSYNDGETVREVE